jgi:hypothetical protein
LSLLTERYCPPDILASVPATGKIIRDSRFVNNNNNYELPHTKLLNYPRGIIMMCG